jgi:hypothetical protein
MDTVLVVLILVIMVALVIGGYFLLQNQTTVPDPTPAPDGDDSNQDQGQGHAPIDVDVKEDCMGYITKFCKPNGGDLSCQEYSECRQNFVGSELDMSGCLSWFTKNCSDFKPAPGPGAVTNNVFTWSGPFYKINALGGGGLAAMVTGFDIETMDTLVLNITSFDNTPADTSISFGLSVKGRTAGLKAKFKSITASVTTSPVKDLTIATYYQETPYSPTSNVYIYDPTDPTVQGVKMLINTNMLVTKAKSITFTIHFSA